MNKKGSGPTMTMIMIGAIIFTGVMLLIYSSDFGIYTGFLEANQQSISPEGLEAYEDIVQQQGDLTTIAGEFEESGKSLFKSIKNIPSNIFQTASLGLNAVTMLFEIPSMINNIIDTIGNNTPIPTPLIWIVTTTLGVYFISQFIKWARNTPREP